MGDVAVRSGVIDAVDTHIPAEAARRINGRGLVLAPGFIDMHAHTDTYHLTDPAAEIRVRQGICLDVVGNCAMSVVPTDPQTASQLSDQREFACAHPHARTVADYAAALDQAQPAMRVMTHAGHDPCRSRGAKGAGHGTCRPPPLS